MWFNMSKMINDILKTSNDFFDPKYIDDTPKPKRGDFVKKSQEEEKFSNLMKQKMKKIIDDSGIFEQAKNYEKIPLIHTLPSMLKLTLDLMKDPDYQQVCLKNLKFLAENENYWIKKKQYLDSFLYFNINPKLNQIVAEQTDCIAFFEEYFNFIEKNIQINEIFNSLNFIVEERKKYQEMVFNKPISELMKLQNWMFFEKVRKSKKGDFRMYFNDWTLKNSQIIEYNIKAIFNLLLQIHLLLEGTEIEDIKLLIAESDSIGKILHFFNHKNSCENLAKLRIYRNATFHHGVNFIYNEQEKMKKLVFEDKYGKFDIDIDGFIADFKKLIIFISTFNYMIANILYKHEHNGKNFFQVNYKYAVTHGMRVFWKSLSNELLKDKFHKYFA